MITTVFLISLNAASVEMESNKNIYIPIPRSLLTGSYNNNFYVFNSNGSGETMLQADKSAFKLKKNTPAKSKLLGKKSSKKEEINVDMIDFNKKILHATWHPKENSLAIAATNNLFIISQL